MSTICDSLDQIDEQIASRSLLTHPFYQAWTQGTLSREALRSYSEQYYHHVAAFPTYLSAVHTQTEDPVIRRQLLANLIDEEAGSPNHPELWLQFAEALGLTRQEVFETKAWPETKDLIETFRLVCRGRGTTAGVAALYAYESQIPAIAEAKIEGLRKFYGIDEEGGLAYFTVHREADRAHAGVERHLLASLLNESNMESVTGSVERVLEALWELLSGVCRRHLIPFTSTA